MTVIVNFFGIIFFYVLLIFIVISSVLFLIEKIFSGLGNIIDFYKIDFSMLESMVYNLRRCSVDIMVGLIPITIFLIIMYGMLNDKFV